MGLPSECSCIPPPFLFCEDIHVAKDFGEKVKEDLNERIITDGIMKPERMMTKVHCHGTCTGVSACCLLLWYIPGLHLIQ